MDGSRHWTLQPPPPPLPPNHQSPEQPTHVHVHVVTPRISDRTLDFMYPFTHAICIHIHVIRSLTPYLHSNRSTERASLSDPNFAPTYTTPTPRFHHRSPIAVNSERPLNVGTVESRLRVQCACPVVGIHVERKGRVRTGSRLEEPEG